MTAAHGPSSPGPRPPTGAAAVVGVTKNFGAVQALRGVSLEFPAGQVTALMGENGAAKSTLLKILTGDHQPTEGHVTLDGARLDLAHRLGPGRREFASSRTSRSPRSRPAPAADGCRAFRPARRGDLGRFIPLTTVL
ncbi:ATP-binding cassette domain-containing protein [Streptomyces sp. NBC_00424]|uniref:ATP-binding cassette domain-containing protein n=1 Tax=Streptomyces sp. NBC_00424 TaxID=2903648 RepID=UPI002B1D1B78|nr:ATP-binding cassette domain-containing protein [Streptomyces sp. NBC_00424]